MYTLHLYAFNEQVLTHSLSHISLAVFLYFRQCPLSTSQHQTQTSPMTSETCILPSQASQQQYQAISLSQSLAFPPAQTGSVTQGLFSCVAPFGQPFPGETFAMVSHGKQMLETLKEENQSLRQELHKQTKKASKLQRVLVCLPVHLSLCNIRIKEETELGVLIIKTAHYYRLFTQKCSYNTN